METQTFTTLRTTRTAIEAELLMATLRSAGLHPVDLNTAGHFSLAGVEIEFPVRVPTEESTEAKTILESYDAAQNVS